MGTEEMTAARTGRRTGRKGREARLESRRAGTAGLVVRPGMPSGVYKPLADRDVERIHSAALDVLERIGVGDPIPEILDATLPKGGELGEDGRLRFPRALIEDVIARAPRD